MHTENVKTQSAPFSLVIGVCFGKCDHTPHLAPEPEHAHDARDRPGETGRHPDSPFADLRNGRDRLRQSDTAAELGLKPKQ